jgi:translation initiation factor 1
MSDKNNRLVYSTDPEPESEPTPAPADTPRNPAAPFARQGSNPVRVWLDRKGRKGKTVTVIKGVMSPEVGKKALLKLLKSKLGTGGTLRDGDIEIQGDHRDKIVAILQELGYPAKKAGG